MARAEVVLVCALFLLTAAASEDHEDERFVGWRGDTYKPQDVDELQPSATDGAPDEFRQWIQVISWKPRAFVFHNFLSIDECKHVLQLSAPQMKRSTVVGPNNTGVVDNIRTSAGMFIGRNTDKVITTIEERLALWSQLPASHQEDMQVLRYGPTNKYGPHLDGLERVASVLIYLVTPEEGGETAFPNSDGWLHPEAGEPTQGPFSACAKGHVAYKPKRGDALMFFDMTPDYKNQDHFSMHTGCPVVKGVKWNAVKWLHGTPFRLEEYQRSLSKPNKPLPDPGICMDLHERCQEWAEVGECDRNPGYMTGSDTGQGMCRLACQACRVCKKGDTECLDDNRRRGGYLTFDPKETKGLLEEMPFNGVDPDFSADSD